MIGTAKKNAPSVEEFIRTHVFNDTMQYYGTQEDAGYIRWVSEFWANDNEPFAVRRLEEIRRELPNAVDILDMASGCGTFVYHGLLNGYRMVGIEPESWKLRVCGMKIAESSYPTEWSSHFYKAIGEHLPFKDNSFDCVGTFQTLEHVQDIQKCLQEVLRVVRSGGAVQIMCPDYRTGYEPHYRIPWVPFLPHNLKRLYLSLMGKPLEGLDSLRYTSPRIIRRHLRFASRSCGKHIVVEDRNRKDFERKLYERHLGYLRLLYPAYRLYLFFRFLFRREFGVNLFVRVR